MGGNYCKTLYAKAKTYKKQDNKLFYTKLFVNIMIKKPTFQTPIWSGNSEQKEPPNGMPIAKLFIVITVIMIHIHTNGGFFMCLIFTQGGILHIAKKIMRKP